MIELRGVSFTYPRTPAPVLEGIDLEVAEGEFLLVAGASGQGKSTLLRVPPRLVPHHSGGVFEGRAFIDGDDVTAAAPRDLAGTVGFVPQDPDSHATADRVEAELAFAMENLGVPPVRMRKRIEEVLDQLGLADLRERRLDTLSGGERQRVAIAAVLTAQPKVLILDEPTSSLDPRSAEDVLSMLVRLRDDLGLTIVCAEHRLERVAAFADRVLFLTSNGVSPVAAPTREAFRTAPFVPPVTEIGRALGWQPLPLTVREGRHFARNVSVPAPVRAARTEQRESILSARDVRFRIGATEILQDASLGLVPGEITAVCGRNGAGKTTLLRALLGLVRPDSGEVVFDGEPMPRRGWPPATMRRMAYVPQRAEAVLYLDTVDAEIRTSCGPERAKRLLDAMGLGAYRDRHPWTLSAGQRLRTALASALGRGADVLLLDEPTRGLDPPGKDVLTEILRSEAERGAAVGVVTHDVELVARMADRVALMASGRIVTEGAVHEVLGESLLFSSQTSKVMADPRFLVPADVIGAGR